MSFSKYVLWLLFILELLQSSADSLKKWNYWPDSLHDLCHLVYLFFSSRGHVYMTGLHLEECVKGSGVRDVLCSSLLFSHSHRGKLEVKRDSFLAPEPEGSLGTKVSLRQRKSVHNTFRLAQGDAALTSVTVGALKKKKKNASATFWWEATCWTTHVWVLSDWEHMK